MDFSVTGRNKEKARVMASPFRKKPGKDESRDYEEYRLSLNGSWDFMLAEGDELPDIEKFFVSQNIIDEDKEEKLIDILGKPMLLVSGFDSDSETSKQMKQAIFANVLRRCLRRIQRYTMYFL